MSSEVVELIVRLNREDRSWGSVRAQGELAKLGTRARGDAREARSRPPWPGAGTASRPDLGRVLKAQAKGILATEFFSVGSVVIKRLYVLFAIEHASRRAPLFGATEHPGNGFATQVARDLTETARQVKFLFGDPGTKFTASS